jgi:hypothetical protein
MGTGREMGPTITGSSPRRPQFMHRQRKDLGMLVTLRRSSIDATIIDDQRWRLKRFQDRPSRIDIRDIEVVSLEGIMLGRYHSHGSKDTILVDQQTMS